MVDEPSELSTLRSRAELLSVTLASIGDGVIATDTDGLITSMNSVAESLTGWKITDAADVSLASVFRIVNESSRLPVETPVHRALKLGVVVGLANHTILIARDGREIPIDDSAAPIRNSSGEVIGCVLVFRDITERKQQEIARAERIRLVSLRADVGTALSAIQVSAVALKKVCEALVEHIDVAFARIWTLESTGRVLELQASAGLYTHLDGSHSRVRVGEFKIGRIAANRLPHFTNSVANDPEVSDHEWAIKTGMVAFAGFPLMVENRVVGVLAMFSRNELSESVLSDLRPLAEGISQYIERRNAEAERDEALRRITATLESITDGFIAVDDQWRFTYINAEAGRILGSTLGDLLGKELWQEFPGLLGTDFERLYRRAAANHSTESLIAFSPDHGRWYEVRAFPASVGLSIYLRDVSETKRSEVKLFESEAFSRSIFENSPDCIKVLDQQGRLLRMNVNGMCLMEIEDIEPIVGQYWFELWPAIGQVDVHDALAAARAGGIGRFHRHRPTAKGNDKWWDVIVAAVRDSDDNPIRFVAVSRDVTDRHQAEEKLREAEEQFRTLAENISQLAWMARKDGHIYWYNRRWYEYTGTSPETQAGWGWESVHDPSVLPAVLENWRRSIATGEPFDMVFPLRGADGVFRPFLTRVTPVRDSAGQVIQWLGTNTDVSKQLATEEKLRLVAAELSEADRRKNEFLAILAHELRNPLAPIRNGLEVMKLASGDQAIIQHSREILERQVEQMTRLVDDLMDVSRISRGRVELKLEEVPMSLVIKSALETSIPLIEKMGHQLSVTLPDKPIMILADPTRLAQVLLNLLNNAAKYSEHGGRIHLVVEHQGNEVQVSVRDEGVGIASEHLPRIFELFSQVDQSLEKSQGGLGIGLSLVRRLVDMHGGTVEARSEGLGCGAEFVLKLPIIVVTSEPTHVGDLPTLTKSQTSLRILIVDDNRDSANTLAILLKFIGNETRTAYDGEEAVVATMDFQPDVILLDIGLPKLNGYEACQRIRQLDSQKRSVIIAQTGWGQSEDRQRTQAAGFDYHLVKPVNPSTLMQLLTGIVDSK